MCLPNYTITLTASRIAQAMQPPLSERIVDATPLWEIESYQQLTNGPHGEGLFYLCNDTGDLEPLLDQHLQVTNAAGDICYCGYVEAVYRCCGDYVAWGWDAANLFNAIAITWIEHDTRQRTAWHEDRASILRHGRRELIVPLPDHALYTPDDYAARLLLELRRPQPTLHNTYKCRCHTTYLRTRGYLNTLTWQSYTNTAGYAATGANFGHFTTLSNAIYYCQAITNPVAEPWTITHIYTGLRKVGDPQVHLGYSLHTACDGPALAAGTIPPLAVSPTMRYVESELPSPGLTIEPDQTLYLRLYVAGTDVDNYYQVATAYLADGIAATSSPDLIAWSSLDHTIAARWTERAGLSTQLRTLLNQANFINTITERTEIGHFIPTYRPGYVSLYAAVEQLLQLGDPEGLRLQLTMDCDRNVTVTTIHPLDPTANATPAVELGCCGCPTVDLCQLTAGRWLTPQAGLSDVPGIFLDAFSVNYKACRTRFTDYAFSRTRLADYLRYPGVF